MTTMVLSNNVVLHEGVITSKENAPFFEKLQQILKDSAIGISGGSFFGGEFWLGLETCNSGERIIARKIMRNFGFKDFILNGTHYYSHEV
jgi:hypothetical protein